MLWRWSADSVGFRQEVQYGCHHQRARDGPDRQHDLLFPGRGANDIAGFEILQVIARDAGDSRRAARAA